MARFLVGTLVVCSVFLLALQVFAFGTFLFSSNSAQATSHSGCADGTTEQNFGSLPNGAEVHGCDGSVTFANADSLCAPSATVGDVVLDNGLKEILGSIGSTGGARWIRMDDDPGNRIGGASSIEPMCWGTLAPCSNPAHNPDARPAHTHSGGGFSLYYNGALALQSNGNNGDRFLSTLGAICVAPPPPPDVTITDPPASSWQNGDFQVQFDAQGVDTCEVETNDSGAGWQNRGTVSCTAGNADIQVGPSDWCTQEGQDECGVRIVGIPPVISHSEPFDYTGSSETWSVPPGVSEIEVELWGAQGWNPDDGGRGGYVKTKLAIPSGTSQLEVFVGGAAPGKAGGFNGGGHGGDGWIDDLFSGAQLEDGYGGGGASDIRLGGTTLTDRVAVAGGGGGGGRPRHSSTEPARGGGGGNTEGEQGEGGFFSGVCSPSIPGQVPGGGMGGTDSAGGIGGHESTWATPPGGDGQQGSSGIGGAGGNAAPRRPGTTGGGIAGGGGGGGYFGGGGGGGADNCSPPSSPRRSAAGGGGSSWITSDPDIFIGPTTHQQGIRQGDGQVIIRWFEPIGPSVQDEEFFNIDLTAPTVNSFTASDGDTTVDHNSDPLVAVQREITLEWDAQDASGGSGLGTQEVWQASYEEGSCDENTQSGCNWQQQTTGNGSAVDRPIYGKWLYGIQAHDQSLPAGNCITEAGGHCGGVPSDSLDPRAVVGPIVVEIPVVGGLVPCGRQLDAVDTPYDETEECRFAHTFLLLHNLVSFTLWTLVPIILVLLVILTGAVFYFSFGGPNTLAYVRRIWRYVGIGVLVLAFSWLFLNFLLGVLDFNINMFGRWYEFTE